MAAEKIDFASIREAADFHVVANHYGIELIKDGATPDQFKGTCPFHDDAKPSLKINTAKNIYNCFPCGAGGNILNFVKEMEGIDYRAAARILQNLNGKVDPAPKPKRQQKAVKKQKPASSKSEKTSGDEYELEDEIKENAPLTFELKDLDTSHSFLTDRAISQEIIETFGLGITQRSKLLKGRLVIPIHNEQGNLVAYCGRYPSNDIPEDEAKYKLPPNFHKEMELFNWHRCKDAFASAETNTLVLVESYFSVFHLHEHFPTVSPMGWSVSETQMEMMKIGGVKHVVLLFDGDDAGRKAIIKAGREFLAAGIACVAPVVPEDFKPHRTTIKKLTELIF